VTLARAQVTLARAQVTLARAQVTLARAQVMWERAKKMRERTQNPVVLSAAKDLHLPLRCFRLLSARSHPACSPLRRDPFQ
jgi:hypothetical protein